MVVKSRHISEILSLHDSDLASRSEQKEPRHSVQLTQESSQHCWRPKNPCKLRDLSGVPALNGSPWLKCASCFSEEARHCPKVFCTAHACSAQGVFLTRLFAMLLSELMQVDGGCPRCNNAFLSPLSFCMGTQSIRYFSLCQQAERSCSILYRGAEVLNVVTLSVECRGPTMNNVAVCCVGVFLTLYKASSRLFGPYTLSLWTFEKEFLVVTLEWSSFL